MHLQIFGVVAGLVLRAQAAITIHYFNQASCNANTAQSVYSNADPAAQNTGCVDLGIAGIHAIYIDGIDDGCTIRTYSDASCNENLGLSITAGTCYYKDSSPIGSWRAVCGSSAASSTDSVVTIPLTSSSTVGADTASAPESSTTMASSMATTGVDVGPILTSVETVTPTMTQAAPPTDEAPMATPMATQMPTAGGNGSEGGNGTSWNMTHSKLAPTGSPGLQGTGVGSGMGTSSAERSGDWKGSFLKALGCIAVVEGVKGWLV